MDSNLLNKYKEEMLKMYRSVSAPFSVAAPLTQPSNPSPPPLDRPQPSTEGYLIGIATTVRSLYPVKGAKVTVFTGSPDNMQIIDTGLTDQSGRTKAFSLPTPEKALSLNENNTVLPYALYNIAFEADGYIKNIHLNIPVFSTVTSLQQSNLLLTETAGADKGPQIFDEAQKYEL